MSEFIFIYKGPATPRDQFTEERAAEAENLDAAKAFTGVHPFLSEGNGRFSLDIFELVDINM